MTSKPLDQSHEPLAINSSSQLDYVVCSCGWKSVEYFDGIQYAVADFKKHVRDIKENNRI